jgi:hypothetical protein
MISPAQEQPGVIVDATMDVFQAGGNIDNSRGSPPVTLHFVAREWSYLTFRSMLGSWTCQNGTPDYGPDGETSGYCLTAGGATSFPSIGLLSGYRATDFVGPLVGVFLADTLPASPPSSLVFHVGNSSEGGIPTDFRILNPEIGQVFFIGDGLTGTGTGAIQAFVIPPAATHLYLGYVDSCMGTNKTCPGCYGDNVGSAHVIATLHE